MERMRCVNCGASINYDPNERKVVCPYCDSVHRLKRDPPKQVPVPPAEPARPVKKRPNRGCSCLVSVFLIWFLIAMIAALFSVFRSVKAGIAPLEEFYAEEIRTPQEDALESAQSYLRFSSFSYEGLIQQLTYEDYTHEDAVYAADHCGADWFEQALKSAESYMSFSAFSYEGLIDQLEFDKFTNEQAVYAADNCGADWFEQALKSAQNYLDYSAFSYEGLISQLEYEEFTNEQAVYAADHCGADWFEQAVKCAKSYLDCLTFSREELIGQLKFEGFTHDQAVYGAEQNGYTQ